MKSEKREIERKLRNMSWAKEILFMFFEVVEFSIEEIKKVAKDVRKLNKN